MRLRRERAGRRAGRLIDRKDEWTKVARSGTRDALIRLHGPTPLTRTAHKIPRSFRARRTYGSASSRSPVG
ncbi:hypothetical protein GCM10020367_16790 [Streptomyces sannanensis]|uniref:Uncharacterized protein n=1 Tax=Streptomyces sannanensis TaxID=285536 RepID=A0ABP6S879_9ACTN